MMKKMISMVLAILLLASFAACGGGGASSAGSTAAPAASSQAAPASSAPAASSAEQAPAEMVEVVFWDMQVGGENYPSIATEHAKKITETYPNITISYQSIPWANRYETFTTAIAAKEAPDMSTGGGYQSFQFAATGEILDISSVIDEWRAEGVLDKYNIDHINYFQYNGMQVGVPWNFEPRYMLYRTDWFEEAGIEPPTTWDELYDAAVHFTDASKGVYGLVYPAAASPGNVLFYTWFAMNGTGMWSEDGKSLDWTNPKNVEALDFIRKLRDAGVFPEGLAAYENNEANQLALQDGVAMVIIVGGNNAALFADAGVQDKWAILPAPAGPSANGNNGTVAAINAIMAYSQTEHPEETKHALKWWSENKYDLWTNKAAAVSGIPVRTDWLADPNYRSTMADPFMGSFIDNCIDQTHLLIYPATNISAWLTQNAFDGERWGSALSQAVLTDPRSTTELLQDWQDRGAQVQKDFDELG